MGMYEDLVDFLFDGAVPVEEIRKMDASEVHVLGPLQKKKKAWEEKSTPEKVGVATSYGGAAAGPAAIYMAAKTAREGKGGMPRDLLRSAGGKRGKAMAKWLDSPKSRNAKIAAGAASAGIVGLQTANWVGDTVNSKQLSRSKNEMIDDITETKVKKMVHDAIMAGVPSEEVMEMIEKAAAVDNAAKFIVNGQRLLGASAAAATGGTAWAMGRKRTNKSTEAVVEEVLNERGVTPQPVRKPLQFKPLPKTDYGIMPTVVESKYKADVKKSDVDLEWEGEISKMDTEKRQVFGWCSITKVDGQPVVDRQNDYIPDEEMERSAYDYVLHSRKGGDMHQRIGDEPLHKSDMIESFVVTPEKLEKMGIDPNGVPTGWWVGFKVNDDTLWDEVKKGDKVHFSVHGRGKRVKEYI